MILVCQSVWSSADSENDQMLDVRTRHIGNTCLW